MRSLSGLQSLLKAKLSELCDIFWGDKFSSAWLQGLSLHQNETPGKIVAPCSSSLITDGYKYLFGCLHSCQDGYKSTSQDVVKIQADLNKVLGGSPRSYVGQGSKSQPGHFLILSHCVVLALSFLDSELPQSWPD